MVRIIGVQFFKPPGMPGGLIQILILESEFSTFGIRTEPGCHHAQS